MPIASKRISAYPLIRQKVLKMKDLFETLKIVFLSMFLGLFFALAVILSYFIYQWFREYAWVRMYLSIGLATILLNSFLSVLIYRTYPLPNYQKKRESVTLHLAYFAYWLPFLTILLYCWPGFWLILLYGIPVLKIVGFVEDMQMGTINSISSWNLRFFSATLVMALLINFTNMFGLLESCYEVIDATVGAL